LQIQSERGYLIPAINTDTADYVACAEQLAESIRKWHPEADITILTKEMLPYGDLGGFANDWQCFYASPYRQTIKLEADMYAASPIDHWWTLFEKRDVVISQGCRDIYNEPSSARHYRRIFDVNQLPDVYNAVTYWRRSHTSKDFFDLVRNVFENWAQYRTLLKFPDEEATTDVVYGVVAAIMGVDTVTLPPGLGPSIVHMKRYIVPTIDQDWTKELVWEDAQPGLRIQTVAQQGLVHYHVKDWRIS
jgi:hypothetical protein